MPLLLAAGERVGLVTGVAPTELLLLSQVVRLGPRPMATMVGQRCASLRLLQFEIASASTRRGGGALKVQLCDYSVGKGETKSRRSVVTSHADCIG